MSLFRLYATVTVSAVTLVEADSLEAAIEIAKARSAVLGGMGSGATETSDWIIDDADGEPQNIEGHQEP